MKVGNLFKEKVTNRYSIFYNWNSVWYFSK